MKLLKTEKLWLILGIAAYLFYNIPGLPAYHDFRGAVIHNILAFVLIWGINYYFFFKVCKIYKPRKPDQDEKAAAGKTAATELPAGKLSAD